MLPNLLLLLLRGASAQDLLVPDFGFASLSEAGIADDLYNKLLAELKERGLQPTPGSALPPQAVGFAEECLSSPNSSVSCPSASKMLTDLNGTMIVIGMVRIAPDGLNLTVTVRAYGYNDAVYPVFDLTQTLVPGTEATFADSTAQRLAKAYGRLPPRPGTPVKDPPVDPVVKDPPVDPVVKDPPVDPVVKDPPVDPVVKDPPVDPVVKDPPVDPVVKDPPVDPLPVVDLSPCTDLGERTVMRLSPSLYTEYCAETLDSSSWKKKRRVRAGQLAFEVQAGRSLWWVEETYNVHTRVSAGDQVLFEANDTLGNYQIGDGSGELVYRALDQLTWTDVGGVRGGFGAGPTTLTAALSYHPTARWELGLRGGAILNVQRQMVLSTSDLELGFDQSSLTYPTYRSNSTLALIEPRARWYAVARGPIKPYALGALGILVFPTVQLASAGEKPITEGLDLSEEAWPQYQRLADPNDPDYKPYVPYTDRAATVALGLTGGVGLAVDLHSNVSLFVESPFSWVLPLGVAEPAQPNCKQANPLDGDGCFTDNALIKTIQDQHHGVHSDSAPPLMWTLQSGVQVRF